MIRRSFKSVDMKESTYKQLTVIVPTYNRKESLARGLRALISQVESHRDEVSLYVSDNCSTDGTQDVVKEFQAKHPGVITYKRQPNNLGAQGNFKDAVKSVTAKYVVLFGDDDVVLPGYVDEILAVIQRHQGVALINYNGLAINSRGKYTGVRDHFASYGENRLYEKGGDFIIDHTHFSSLVSSNVFLREPFITCRRDIADDMYPGYAWYAALLKSIINKPCVYIDRPLFVANGPAVNRWESNALKYYVRGLGRLFKDLDDAHPGIWRAWQSEFELGWMLESCLSLASQYRKVYAKNKEELLQYATSARFRRLLELHLKYPGELLRVVRQISRAINWIFRKSI